MKTGMGRRQILFTGAAAIALSVCRDVAFSATASTTSHARDLYDAAKKEGEFTWYTSHSDDTTAQAVGHGFESAWPGIRANVVRTTAQVAFQRVSEELKAGAVQVDVLSSTDIGHYVYLKDHRALAQYTPENADKVLGLYQHYDPDGYYFVTSAGLIGMVHNPSRLKLADAPKNWTDLTAPKWKDGIALGHPGFSGYVGTWAVMMRKLYGWQFFDSLAKNNPQIGRSINDAITMINVGERLIAGTALMATAAESRQKGNPLAMIYPTDGTVLILAPSGIMKGSKHPNAAKLFMEYLLSVDASKIWVDHFFESIRPEVAAAPDIKSANELKVIRPDSDEIVKGIPEVIEQWRNTFGV
ncbi:ABC transporter substrate-binding protein [Paraburkholderia adhaesiva]|uniref:ABC transporter substrate-binding protein n=1 Tax=Paraburkholderia adhaesiva TaxID=2883244 RepID=UPI001F46BB9F|nr:extracellular solute-binding protein [Paraburkholderia adhaesiva]